MPPRHYTRYQGTSWPISRLVIDQIAGSNSEVMSELGEPLVRGFQARAGSLKYLPLVVLDRPGGDLALRGNFTIGHSGLKKCQCSLMSV